ncbi:hypothetical protein CYLTODRAFT_28060 [Cylindrobasidium torrendii FP15055 ss-10]|uniref:F-box domain-containing protein n=1 Tax=Cylindrobasidium torrendii FP15055 ss-10 TaxID=1314674 RepID=A0A0D7BQP7_9AGAR|nr:hypothetical protein CYLTODRAFT_28060 [Cylindrobasidium torrendii FP15055 ss-10]
MTSATMPPELLQLIVDYASLSVLKVLRRVSKSLHMAASRRLFTTLMVDDDHSELLACLAAHDSHLAPAFNALELKSLSKGRRSFLHRVIPCSKRSAPDNFLIALRHLEQVSSVSIDVKAFRGMPVDVRATTIQALGALPSLSNLKLDLLRDEDAAVAPIIASFAHTFRNLRALHIVGGAAHYSTLSTIVKNSPHLTSLTVHARRRSIPADGLGQLLRSAPDTTCIDTLDVDAALAATLSSTTIMQHLGSLRYLTIGAGAQETIWDLLRSSQIKLHALKTSSPSTALMAYLQSFTGLRSLSVDCIAPSEYLRALRVNTGHMKDSVMMKDELDSRWAFQFA